MFFVSLKLHGKPENVIDLTQTLQCVANKLKIVEGCVDVQIYKILNDENIFFFAEEWKKQRNLEKHMKSDLFAALMGTKGSLLNHRKSDSWLRIKEKHQLRQKAK
jgi:quinol monooxygenase YgiN